jgi:heterodisulfide reductase subunit B2
MATRSYAYYPGCSLHASAKEYDVSTRMVMGRLGIDLREIENWTCCGASSAHAASKLLGYALPARNLQIAEQMGLPLMSSCAACFSRLKATTHDLARDLKMLAAVNEAIDRPFLNSVEVTPILGALVPEEVAAAARRPLEGLKVACYYGCLFVRPGEVVGFDDEEDPRSMDRLLAAAGAETVDWAFKTECCGASMAVPRPGEVERLSGRVLAAAKRLGADCVAVACPLCHANLDQRQGSIGAKLGKDMTLPVLYFTQLLGLALGFPAREMMLERHFADPRPMLRAKGLVQWRG